MKNINFVLGLGLASWLAGCSSTPVAPVGPNPNRTPVASSTGVLEVYSRQVAHRDDQEIGGNGAADWNQHGNYTIYAPDGTARQVRNAEGRYEVAPKPVTLKPGKYVIKAQAADFAWVEVPVTIEPGRTTRVHLDYNWSPPPNTPKDELVTLPNGRPIGWVTRN
jgi:hypothetical protein